MNASRIAFSAAMLCALVATFGVNAEDEKCKNHYILNCPVHAIAETQTAVEYYYYPWDFYFVTSFPEEIAALDAQGAWQRTGPTFSVWPKPNASASPTCRFFTTAFAPKSTHFYTPFPDECAIVKTEPAWQFESIAFYIALADASGQCGGGTMPLYRVYNNGRGGAPNHRYTTRLPILHQMLAAGWAFEGNGNTMVFACVPQGAHSAAEGLWFGSGSQSNPFSSAPAGHDLTAHGVILDTGEYYFVYTDNTGVIQGFVHGSSTAVNGTFSFPDARFIDFSGRVSGHYHRFKKMQGTYVAGSTVDIQLDVYFPDDYIDYHNWFAAAYQPVYAQPISLATVAGSYSGLVYAPDPTGSYAVIPQNFNLTVDSNGTLSGSVAGCTSTGTVTPHGAVNVLDATLTFGGVGCFLSTSTFAGIAFYDASARTLYVAADNGFVFGGAK